jgi:hypothetical protein
MTGNYRDVAQNRRNDVLFFPRMASFDVQQFLSFIQPDGYEPLTVEGIVFRITDEKDADMAAEKVTKDAQSAKVLGEVLKGGPFRPGQIFDLTERLQINLTDSLSNEAILNEILALAEDRNMAQFGQGYWGDHWDYYLVSCCTYSKGPVSCGERSRLKRPLQKQLVSTEY